MEHSYSDLRLKDLKELCEEKGLKKTGNKADLIYRLQNPTDKGSFRPKSRAVEKLRSDEPPQIVHLRRRTYKILQDCDVYIGRKCFRGGWELEESIWRNNCKTLEEYKAYILSNEELMSKLHTLKGKRLGCWCSPKACHGDVLVELFKENYCAS